MANLTIQDLPDATLPVLGTDKTIVSRNGTTLNDVVVSALPISTATQTALDAKAPLASPTFTGTVGGITKTMVGLGNVDNTSDASKATAISTQTLTLTNKTIDGASNTLSNVPQSAVTNLVTDLSGKAGLASINSFTQINQAPANVLTTGATLTPDANKVFQTFTTSANFTIAAPTNRPSAGNLRVYEIKIIYTGAHSATSLNAVYKYNGTAPAFSNTSGKYDILICHDDGTDISYELKAGYTS